MSSKRVERNGQPEETAIVKHATPNGRILYDVMSILQSETTRRHFDTLERMAERGMIRRPAPAK